MEGVEPSTPALRIPLGNPAQRPKNPSFLRGICGLSTVLAGLAKLSNTGE
jgi:hypothetical protein